MDTVLSLSLTSPLQKEAPKIVKLTPKKPCRPTLYYYISNDVVG